MGQELTQSFVFEKLPKRRQETHKGSYGSVLVVAGSSLYRGAAALTVEGALRTGAGIVTLATVEPVIWGITPRLPECCFAPCAANAAGGIRAGEADNLLKKLEKATVLLFGPGLTNTEDTQSLLEALVPKATCPVILDADGLNAAAALLEQGKPLPRPAEGAPLILTPHTAEMARISGISVDEITAGRESVASTYARANDCVLVLKGHRTIIAAPSGETYKNTTGNAGLARGGSGDVLAGMLAGLLACGLSAVDAAACAVWLHGAAADETARRMGQYGMLPHDIFYDLARIFAQNER